MSHYTYPELCTLAGFTVEQADKLGLCRAELVKIINGLKMAA